MLSTFTFAQNQKFIPLDEDTMEFINEVHYTWYFNKKPIYTDITSTDSVTRFPKNIIFDSISFNKINYKEIGLNKNNLKDFVLLNKSVLELNEVIIVAAEEKEIIIGEKSRFIKRNSHTFSRNPDYGILIRYYELINISLEKFIFFVEKVRYKTNYKIMMYLASEIKDLNDYKTLRINEILFESPTLTLDKGTKDKVEIDLEHYNIDFSNKNVFITIELQDYQDENNKIELDKKNHTRLKFQMSEKSNYYGKMSDAQTGDLTTELININEKIKSDFIFMSYDKPHKSLLVAPAILLRTKIKK